MKKLIIAALLVISVSSFAQEQTQAEGKPKKEKREKQTPEQRSQAQLDKLTTELALNAQQQEQIKPILADQNAKMEAMRAQRMNGKEMTTEERDAFRAKRQEDRKATDSKLQAILTPDQFKKMKDIEKANMDKMRESRGNGNWGGNRDNGGDRDNGGN